MPSVSPAQSPGYHSLGRSCWFLGHLHPQNTARSPQEGFPHILSLPLRISCVSLHPPKATSSFPHPQRSGQGPQQSLGLDVAVVGFHPLSCMKELTCQKPHFLLRGVSRDVDQILLQQRLPGEQWGGQPCSKPQWFAT